MVPQFSWTGPNGAAISRNVNTRMKSALLYIEDTAVNCCGKLYFGTFLNQSLGQNVICREVRKSDFSLGASTGTFQRSYWKFVSSSTSLRMRSRAPAEKSFWVAPP